MTKIEFDKLFSSPSINLQITKLGVDMQLAVDRFIESVKLFVEDLSND